MSSHTHLSRQSAKACEAKGSAAGSNSIPAGAFLYSRYAAAGAFCCSFTHAVLTPIDVVKTRIQLDPLAYDRGVFAGLQKVIAQDGAGALLTGFGPTVVGYFLQGAFKFGGYEVFKRSAIDALGHEAASKNRNTIYLASSAFAEFLGDLALCPFEAVRIRLVSEPAFARGLVDGFYHMAKQEGASGFYAGLGPVLLKQIPYTMATFVVYEKVLEQAYRTFDRETLSTSAHTAINIGSGLAAGLAAAVVSQPADTMLSKINEVQSQRGEKTLVRLYRIACQLGIRGSFAGIRARLIMVGGMTACQFAIYGNIKQAMGATGGVEIV